MYKKLRKQIAACPQGSTTRKTTHRTSSKSRRMFVEEVVGRDVLTLMSTMMAYKSWVVRKRFSRIWSVPAWKTSQTIWLLRPINNLPSRRRKRRKRRRPRRLRSRSLKTLTVLTSTSSKHRMLSVTPMR